jgi:hypothetical protein
MDYLVLSTVVLCAATLIVMSYDIACQWSRKFYTRMGNYAPRLQLSDSVIVNFLCRSFIFGCTKKSVGQHSRLISVVGWEEQMAKVLSAFGLGSTKLHIL